MRRLSRIGVSLICLTAVLLVAAQKPDEPAKKGEAAKSPWQRLLRGEDAKKAADQEKKLPKLVEAGRYNEALNVAQTLAELHANVQGTDHWQTVSARLEVDVLRRLLRASKEDQKNYTRALFTLHPKATDLYAQGYFPEAQSYFDQVLAVCRKVLGEDHPQTAAGYVWVAFNLHAQGKLKEAEKSCRRALDTYRKVLGEEHPQTAAGYGNLAINLKDQGKFQEAEQDIRKALAICLKVLGEEHSDTAAGYENLSAILDAQGRYEEAGEALRKALACRRKALGEEHLLTARSYASLAASLNAAGQYHEAGLDLRKALTIYRKLLGEEHPNTAQCYSDLALNLDAQGKYSEAEEAHRKALLIRLKTLDENHPLTAASYNNLARNLNAQGKYKEAEDCSSKALSIDRAILGERHRYTATSYGSVAANLQAQGKYEEAEVGFRRSLAIRVKVLGEESPRTATAYNNLAYNLNSQGKYREAEEYYGKALAIRRKLLGEEHPHTATCYYNLAHNQIAQGKYQEAEKDIRKALAIRRRVLCEGHPDTVLSYLLLGQCLNAQGKYQEAESSFLRSIEGFAAARLYIAATGSESDPFTSGRSPFLALAAVLARNGKSEQAWQRFEDGLTRGTWDEFMARLRRSQAERDRQAQITARIDQLNRNIAANTTADPSLEQSKLRDDLLRQLRQAWDELTALSQRLEKQDGASAGQVHSRAQIQESLPADAALIGWIDIPSRPRAADAKGEHWAIVLRSTGSPVWVRLPGSGERGSWTDADTQLPAQLRSALQQAGSDWQPLAERLRKQRLDPLASHLENVRRLVVLPSSALVGVPVEAIADKFTVSYAHSGTMHAHLNRRSTPSGEGLLAVADPVFAPQIGNEKLPPLPPYGGLLMLVTPGSNAAQAGLKAIDVLLRYGDKELKSPPAFFPQSESADPKKLIPIVTWRDGRKLTRPMSVHPGPLGVMMAKVPPPQALAEIRRLELLASAREEEVRWKPLPSTRIEAASLRRLYDKDYPAKLLLGSEASEQKLNDLAQRGELGNYRYIHLATHGTTDNTTPLRSAVILSRDHLPDTNQRTELLLSAKPIPDGRLTVEEMLQRWNLHSDLVTLSSCQPVSGKFERGDGFVSLAQALVLCGTRSVCLSLWKGNDTATALLMERFYQNLLGKREGLSSPMPKAAALMEAKAWLRKLPRREAMKRAAALSEGISRGKSQALPKFAVPAAAEKTAGNDCPFAHPYYWAGFVLIGHAD